jgi:hypothetical protein
VQIAPNRVVSSYSTGSDVRFLCSPLCTRQGPEKTVTWAVFQQKGTVKLMCWIQNGVESIIHTIQCAKEASKLQRMAIIDDVGEAVILVRDDTWIKCYKNGVSDEVWSWEIPKGSKYLQVFAKNDCPLTKNLDQAESILLIMSNGPALYSVSAAGPPQELVSSLSVKPVSIRYTDEAYYRSLRYPLHSTQSLLLSFTYVRRI